MRLFLLGLAITCLTSSTPLAAETKTGATWWQTRDLPALTTTAAVVPVPVRPKNETAPPPLATVLGPEGDAQWSVTSGNFTVEAPSNRPWASGVGSVLTVTSPSGLRLDSRLLYSTGVRLTAMVRFAAATPIGVADFSVGRRIDSNTEDPKKPITRSLRMDLRAAAGNMALATLYRDGKALHDMAALAAKMNWTPQNENDFTYNLRAYQQFLPGWPEDLRMPIEKDMSSLPLLSDKWLAVRIELDKGIVRFWVDDRMIGWRRSENFDVSGAMQIWLTSGAQLAALSVTPLERDAGYLPIRLGGYVNARGLESDMPVAPVSLPPAGNPVVIQGIPFVFAGLQGGDDHLEIGRSNFRQANMAGYIPTMYGNMPRWRGCTDRDPARIQVRIPNGSYDALYVVAATEKKPDTVPLVTAMFYRPGAGFAESFAANVPLTSATSRPSDATPLPIKLENGKARNLWLVKIPLDPGRLSTFGDLDVIEIEFTKQVRLYRTYPDPIGYSYHQAGLPSAVHIYAATLGETPVNFEWKPDRFGHVWTAPAKPSYTATLVNRSGKALSGRLIVATKSYDGSDTTRQEKNVSLPAASSADAPVAIQIPIETKLFGYYDISATLDIGGRQWTERRSFVQLAPDTRSTRWTEGKGAMFGYWSYHGGHHTPNGDLITSLMTEAGARQTEHAPSVITDTIRKHWGRSQGTAYYVPPQEWAVSDNPDPADIENLRKYIHGAVERWEKDIPPDMKPDHIFYFTESHISPRLTAGNFPEYFGDPPFEYTPEEKERLKMFYNTAKIASEIIRKDFPDRKILIEWGDPLFIVPLLRAGYPKDLVDGSGLDAPNFERLPEMQLKDNVIHRFYELRQEYKKAGIEKYTLQFCEGTFVPTEPGAVSYREQMDIYNRWNLISMAYGVDRFHAGWFAFDCANYYGSEHYGGCGIQRRLPYADPKPAYAAFATMTDKLNEANFDGWVKTGSLSTYCLRFEGPKGYVYALWTLRGKRPVTLTLPGDATLGVTDVMNNTRNMPSRNRQVTITTDPSVTYVTGAELESVAVGVPDNTDAAPAAGARQVADLGDGTWSYTSRRDTIHENNHWGFYPAAGKFSSALQTDAARGRVLVSKLEKQDRVRELMPWYNVLKPAKPVPLAGAPSHLGLWVKGNSDWGRVIYVLRDAGGERWVSIGEKDQYNCDDTHAWSSFNFDGWRYLRFELPGHTGYDSFRKAGTTWWRADAADGGKRNDIVDLPLRLEEIMVEQRSHILYVNDVQPVATDSVSLGKLFVEYESAGDATPEAERISRLRQPLPTGLPDLPNPIAEMQRTGVGEPVKITGLKAPEHQYDGTRMHVSFTSAPEAKQYFLWVSAHADGRGAVNMRPAGVKSGDLITGLRPGIKLYYWVTYADEKKQMSKPSPVHEEVTVDNFKEK